MQWLDYKDVEITSLKSVEDLHALSQSDEVLELANSVSLVGLIHAPVVEKSSRRLIAGRKRVAALIFLGIQRVGVRFVRASQRELRVIELAENAHRVHNDKARAAYIVELVRLYEQGLKREKLAPYAPKPRRNPHNRAKEMAAATLGVSTKSIDKAEKKHAENAADKLRMIEMLGMPDLDEEYERKVRTIQRYADEMGVKLMSVQSMISKMKNSRLPLPPVINRVMEETHAVAALIRRELRPVSLCPYCKAVAEVQAECGACYNTGWVGPSALENVPAELMDARKPVVYQKGQIVDIEFEAPPELPDTFGLEDQE